MKMHSQFIRRYLTHPAVSLRRLVRELYESSMSKLQQKKSRVTKDVEEETNCSNCFVSLPGAYLLSAICFVHIHSFIE